MLSFWLPPEGGCRYCEALAKVGETHTQTDDSVDEKDARNTLNVNIYMTLNDLTGLDYIYSRKSTDTPGIPDFNCHFIGLLILVIEAKRKHILEDMGKQTFPEFYNTSKGKDVIQQIYNYMGGNKLRYGILTTYKNHYTFANQQSSSNTPVNQQNYSFMDFKFKSILGKRRSGKTLLCIFCDETITLKSVDLSKSPPYVLEEMQKEVEIYKDLATIQGNITLSDHKITKWQKSRVIKGLEAIHKHDIFHNNIREENILINDNSDIYLIDFGMASRKDTKKKEKTFQGEIPQIF
ncbi:hypothetical protein C1646_777274 [Rhizophagus diaphanus]|nr:hypothetical protein C1646_777274 [Rhizophagus diaphanus] [Rhizophagus sp. MUCL 43196]